MALRRRGQRGLGPVICGSVALALVACGAADTISASPSTPTPAIQPNACDVLSESDVTAAFTTPTSPSATPGAITHIYSVRSISGKTVGQCIWRSQLGAQVIVLVYPKAEVSQLAGYTTGAIQVGPAFIQEGDGRGFVSIQDGPGVLAITLVLVTDSATRTAHLADLARAASGAPVPSLSPGAVPSAAATSGGPQAGGPGSVVQGQSAASKVKESDALKFDPNNVSIQAGQVLEWDNTGSIAHNVTFDDYPTITSDTMNGGDTYQVKFTQPGTYKFHCTFHPGMDGSVTVT